MLLHFYESVNNVLSIGTYIQYMHLIICLFLLISALQPVDVINVTTHVLNSVVSLFDFLLVAHPYRLLHFYWTLIYGLAYVLFTVIYYLAGGTDM